MRSSLENLVYREIFFLLPDIIYISRWSSQDFQEDKNLELSTVRLGKEIVFNKIGFCS